MRAAPRSTLAHWVALAILATCAASGALGSGSVSGDQSDSSKWITPEFVESPLQGERASEPQLHEDISQPAPVFEQMRFAQHFPSGSYVRASYDGRRRAVPYGGMDMSMNPYRSPNNVRLGGIKFFTPKMSNGISMGPDPGLSLANIINSQHAMLQASFNDGMHRMGLGYENNVMSKGFGVGGPGWGFFNRMQRPYGIEPYAPPFSYYSPPPLPSTTTVPDVASGSPPGSSGSAGGDASL